MKTIQIDFRETFCNIADEALITRSELAEVLCTTVGAVSQMIYRGELPPTALPNKRRSVWKAGVIRLWLKNLPQKFQNVEPVELSTEIRLGRPRKK